MQRILITVLGCVQGIGFRPFVYRLAHKHRLVGSIKNTNKGVMIDVQGKKNSLKQFQQDLLETKPQRASIRDIAVKAAPIRKAKTFTIAPSESFADTSLALLPDTAICSLCKGELFDPTNRRYHYPFLHCMTCGPRFSLFLGMPFDRDKTTMTDFTMCEACRSEYSNPDNRRFYSQTNCCPRCGPQLQLLNCQKELVAVKEEAIDIAAANLRQGKIVAAKNTGGYLLLVDATNEEAVNRLRTLKKRPKKPFALLMPDIEHVKQVAHVPPVAETLLTSPAAPIVLLNKKEGKNSFAPSVATDSPYFGIMLPHNAMQLLLFLYLKNPLIATSGNISDNPLCITEEEAFSQLGNIADLFLVHNRRIMNRVDDSISLIIAGIPTLLRRARGYTPHAFSLPPHLVPSSSCILAPGGHLKNSFAWGKKHQIYLSQHIGNLDSIAACQVYDSEIKKWEHLLSVTPTEGVGDKHPDYYTTHYLERQKLATETIQHHEAHVWSCAMDNHLPPPFFAFSWDGTGFGTDHTIWGGEAFLVTYETIERFATLYPFRLPGGETAIREPRRSALGMLHTIFGPSIPPLFETWRLSAFTKEESDLLSSSLNKGINAPLCSSMGRLFDGVSALLDCCLVNQFEGQAALALERVAHQAHHTAHYTLPLIRENDLCLLDWRLFLQEIFEDKIEGLPIGSIALGFHAALAITIVKLAELANEEKVLLTGGVMQNKLLTEKAISALEQAGFKPYWHHDIPPNDGGIAMGQIVGKLFATQRKQHVSGVAG